MADLARRERVAAAGVRGAFLPESADLEYLTAVPRTRHEADRVRDPHLAAGLGDAFSIPSGHGIGLELHEPPRFGAGHGERLRENAVVTVEVAAWRPGPTRAFREDEVVVRATGAERSTSGPDEPYAL